jgi:V/A-type H+/Na+-transporting ATPase subunit E
MGLEAVVEEIRAKGRTEADRIRAESKQETDNILAAAGRRAGEIKLAAEAEITKQTRHIIEQEVSAANLLVKRELLNTQKALLDKVYEATRTEITRLPDSFHREAIKNLLTEVKKEVSRGKIQCNARDVATVRSLIAEQAGFSGFTVADPVDIDGGIIVEGEGGELQIDYSYRTFLDKVWESRLKDASDILFS